MPEPRKELRRSHTENVIAGVLGGIAQYFGWDPTVVRVAFVVGSVLSAAFPGTIVYIILWIIMPLEEERLY